MHEIDLRIYLSLICQQTAQVNGAFPSYYTENNYEYLRNTKLQSRLTALSLMSIEYEIYDEVDFSDIIRSFVWTKFYGDCSSVNNLGLLVCYLDVAMFSLMLLHGFNYNYV